MCLQDCTINTDYCGNTTSGPPPDSPTACGDGSVNDETEECDIDSNGNPVFPPGVQRTDCNEYIAESEGTFFGGGLLGCTSFCTLNFTGCTLW